ncbi:hypothetical protein D1816_23795 [Aquimarina sp. AD10]|uniref:restriction endonuclease subunit S n=1 Tax=Aquimarina sp. AD10 TaxID=1714849 RepID=UPI000E4B95ED|nr:restriction endonuclease subunit S [Aquimarina sp. AD10]AXT63241.1 hypothetical protein D1816_23795 [Aquimarina sp. AD10]RKN00746.1 hypothetical protein D7033_07900 [Aquimarina sp. AD10]
MGVKTTTFKFSDFSTHNLVRVDFKYLNFKKNIELDYNKFYKVKDVLKSYYKGFAFKGKDFSEEGKIYAIKGDSFNQDFSIDYQNCSFLPDDFYSNGIYDRFKVNKNDIIISLVGSIGKMVVVNDDKKSLLNQNNIALQLNQDFYNIKIFSYLLKQKIKILVDNVYNGAGYSFLAIDDLFDIKLPVIKDEKQEIILKKIEPLEVEIKQLTSKINSQQEIINTVFTDFFSIDLIKAKEVDSKNIFQLSLSEISFRNSNFRNSSRWFKVQRIQEFLYKDIDCIEKLGTYITKTKNGWSPNSQEGGDGTPILGQEHFNTNTTLEVSPSKTTIKTRENIKDFYIKKGDFFVSRGNTIDLVALASIVKDEVAEGVLFPDLYIKLEFDVEIIDEEYLAYLFNSFFGRYYFKYVSKGKNQTMVKISSTELDNFYIPIPDKDKQVEIVSKIKTQINAQKEIDKRIGEKQAEISAIIEKAIQESS